MADLRMVVESPINQGVDEIVPYGIDTTLWGGSPSSPTVAVYDITTDLNESGSNDVKSVVMPSGSPSVSANIIALPNLQALTFGHRYRVRVSAAYANATRWSFVFIVNAVW